VRAGATMVLAGLIQESSQTKRSGLPLLSDIPILGALFRTTHEIKGQTELVIFLTPNLEGRPAD
jgi:type II secretory pathway component GspD/PulD (secretin)